MPAPEPDVTGCSSAWTWPFQLLKKGQSFMSLLRQSTDAEISLHSGRPCFGMATSVITCLLAMALSAGVAASESLVSHGGDSGPGSLREAVQQANDSPGPSVIVLAPGVAAIDLTSGQIEITESLIIRASEAGTVIDAKDRSRIFAVTDSDASLVLEGLVLTGARTTAEGVISTCATHRGQGGAVCAAGDLTVIDSTIAENRTDGFGATGAGLFVGGNLVLLNSTVRDNTTTAQMAHGAGLYVRGTSEILDSTIMNNAAHGRQARAGGLYARGDVVVTGSVVSGNLATTAEGAGIYLSRGASLNSPDSKVFENNGQGHAAADINNFDLARGSKPLETDVFYRGSDSFREPRGRCALMKIDAVPVGQTSPPRTVTLRPADPSEYRAVDDIMMRLTGRDADEFQVINNSCSGASLSGEETCTFQVTVTPTVDQGRAAQVEIMPEDGFNWQLLQIEFGLQPRLKIDPAPPEPSDSIAEPEVRIEFGSVPVGQRSDPQTVSWTNVGEADLDIHGYDVSGLQDGLENDFETTSDSCSEATLQPGQTCSIEWTFVPSRVCASSSCWGARVKLRSNAMDWTGDQSQFVLLGGGEESSLPALAQSVTSFHFGSIDVGSSGSQDVSFGNTGGADVVMGTLSLQGEHPAEFGMTDDNCSAQTLAPGQDCSVRLTASPAAAGTFSARLNVPTNVESSPHRVDFTVEGMLASALSTDTSAIDFGSIVLGSASETAQVDLTNTGAADLVFSTLTLSGSEVDDFAMVADNCSDQTLPPGGSCTVTLQATPAALGARSGQLDIPSNAPSSPDSVMLEVTGTQASLGIDPASVDFGLITVGSISDPATLTLGNTGSADLVFDTLLLSGTEADEFSIVADDCSGQTLVPEASCTVGLTVTPAAVGSRSAQLDIASNAALAPHAIALTATGIQAALAIDPPVIEFGPITVGATSHAATVTLTSDGSDVLVLGELALSGTAAAEFALSVDGCSGQTLEPGATCLVTLQATPGVVGERIALLDIPSNAPSSPDSVALGVTGIQAGLGIEPTSLDFGSIMLGSTSDPATLTLGNTGSADLVFDTLLLSGTEADEFSIVADDCSGRTLVPEASCTVGLTVTPAAVGSRSAQLDIASNAALAPHGVALMATGIQSELALSPQELDFGRVGVGRSEGLSLSLSNPGTARVAIEGVSGPQAPFERAGGSCDVAPFFIEPGAECTLEFRFTPTETGEAGSVLILNTDIPDEPEVAVSLTGLGTEASLFLSPSRPCDKRSQSCLDFGEVNVGERSAIEFIVVENAGDEAARVESVSVTGVRSDEFRIVADSCSGQLIEPAADCSIEIDVVPAGVGPSEAQLAIAHDGPESPGLIELAATGVLPELVLSTANIEFESATAEVTLSNAGSGNLTIEEITQPAMPFQLGGGDCLPVPRTLLPEESCNIEINLTGTDTDGVVSSRVEIRSNAPSSPDMIDLTADLRIRQAPLPVPAYANTTLLALALLLFILGWIAIARQAGVRD
jgi:hypothetical protein